MINEFVNTISEQLNIIKGSKEPESNWQKRVLYSSIGINMISATYDYDDDSLFGSESNSVSMQHIHKRGKIIIEAYDGLVNMKFEENDLPGYIRKIYIKTGYILHKNNRLTYPPFTQAKYNGIYLTRGQVPWTVTAMSGIGTYSKKELAGATISLSDMFHFEKSSITEWYQTFESSILWTRISKLPDDIEYVNTTDNISNGYWTSKPPGKGIVLCRSSHEGERVYKLLKINDTIESCTLPSWRVDKHEYLRIALALRVRTGNSPVLVVKPDNSIAVICYNHLLPPFEQNFVDLYSWPAEKNSRYRRIISIQLLPVFIDLFRHMGYRICKGM